MGAAIDVVNFEFNDIPGEKLPAVVGCPVCIAGSPCLRANEGSLEQAF